MDYTRWIPRLQVTIGDYTLTGSFCVVDVANTNMVLGVQWLFSIGENSMNYKIPEMKFKCPNGKLVVLNGMHTYLNQVVSSHSMISIMRHGDIEWDVECLITS